METYPDKIDSKFRFVLLAAHRAEQLLRGAHAKAESDSGNKFTTIAMREISADKVEWDYGAAAEEVLLDEDGEPIAAADEEE